MSDQAPSVGGTAHRNDVVSATLVLAVSAWMWVVSAEFPAVPQRYNRVLIAGLIVLSAIQLVGGAVRWLSARHAAASMRSDDEARPRRATIHLRLPAGTLFLLGSVLYVVAVPRLGYLSSSVIFLVVGLGTAVGWRWRPLAAATALSLAMYLILDRVVNAAVPEGLLL